MRQLRGSRELILAALLLAHFAAPPREAAAQQATPQAKCTNALNKSLATVAATQGKENANCIRKAAPGALEGCLTADPRGRVAKAKSRTLALEGALCEVAPAFGATDAGVVNEVATTTDSVLFHDVFGSNLD